MFHNLRQRIVFFLINREISKRVATGKSISLAKAKKIGLIAVIDEEEKYTELVRLKKSLEGQDKTVKAIGFVPTKEIQVSYLAQMQIDLFSKKNVNFLCIPKSPYVSEFLNEDFDILLDLSIDEYLPVQYLAASAKAKLKVGKYSKKMLTVYDFMIKKNIEMNYHTFLDSMMAYLGQLNTNNK